MARISLRAYNREIENLIERGQIEEAISHAKNIIKQFPKYIETYRLLGKAFLESQRYAEAADILQRVLSVFPDDFVSQLGMSIIREDEGNLDASIWHMERAYEIQPFNRAVQDELRRLYGRRDGIEPPRIRLTRGALVRMYAKGDLYPQAIAEIRAALQEDQNRIDLTVLLARMYFLSGQKIEATEICSSLISKLPYCYDANRILMEVLPETSRAEDARIFQQRLFALDPYAAFISPNAPTTDLVPEQTVMVEKVEWQPSLGETQSPDWARTIGVQWDEGPEENLPEWLNAVAPEQSGMYGDTFGAAEAQAIAPNQAEEITPIPDFMQEAGWSEATGVVEEQAAVFGGQDAEVDEEAEAVEGEIPDWLRSLAPESATQSGADDSVQDEDQMAWLSGLLPAEESSKDVFSTEEGALPLLQTDVSFPTAEEALAKTDEFKPHEALAGEVSIEPGVIDEIGEEQTEVPTWLSGFGDETSTEVTPGLITADESVPEESEALTAGEETPDWIQQAAAEEVNSAADTLFAEETEEAIPDQRIPDWLQQLSTDNAVTEEVEVAPNVAGVEALDELVFAEEGPLETSQTTAEVEQPQAVETSATAQPAPDEMDIDSAMAWLEGLAARQGAEEGTLTISEPEDRPEAPPDWVKQEAQVADEMIAEMQPVAELADEPGEPSEPTMPVAVDGVEDEFDFEEAPAEAAIAEAMTDTEPETIQVIGEPAILVADEAVELPSSLSEANVIEQVSFSEETIEPSATPTVDLDDTDQALAWLEGLAARQGADEETLTISAPEDRPVVPPEWVKQSLEEEQVGELPVGEERAFPEMLDAYVEDSTFPPEQALTIEDTQPTSIVQAAETPVPATPETAPAPADLSDADAAFAWLESLAEKQGAEEGTLITKAEERQEAPPEWVSEALEEAQAGVVEEIHPEPALDTEAASPVSGVIEPVAEELFEEPPAQIVTPVEDKPAGSVTLDEVHAEQETEIPDWLRSYEEEQKNQEPVWLPDESLLHETIAEEELPGWLREEPTVEGVQAEPTAEAEPEKAAPEEPGMPDWLKALQEPPVVREIPADKPAPQLETSVPRPEPVKPTPYIEPGTGPYAIAQAALQRGDLDQAVDGYGQLINVGARIDDIISDLNGALSQHPNDVSLWQLLGDAYMRSNRVQLALDAYTKAEELLR